MGIAQEQLGLLEESLATLERAVMLAPRDAWIRSDLARVLGRLGRREDMDLQVAALMTEVASKSVPPATLAHANAGVNNDRALQWLEHSIEERDWLSVFLRVNPLLDPLRGEQRFEPLVDRVGIPPS
jgi:tetratricopeptide (TPR) repeat protein